MIDLAIFVGWTFEASAPCWEGIWMTARQSGEAGAGHFADGFQAAHLLPQGLTGLTQLDPEVISRQLELDGVGMPMEWTLANFTDQAA